MLNFLVPIRQLFKDYSKISEYLQNSQGHTKADSEAIGDAKLYQSPQKIFNLYNDMRKVVCDSNDLKSLVMKNFSEFVSVNDKSTEKFWPETSSFLCSLTTTNVVSLSNSFAHDFVVPKSIKEVNN